MTPESIGLVGATGPQGNLGPPGPTGPAGRSALTPLQSGETISGLWGHGLTVADPANDFFDIVSFPIPLAADLSDTNVDYVSAGDTDPNCPGPGMAATGFLCVYETDTENASTRFSFNIFKSSDPGGPGGASKPRGRGAARIRASESSSHNLWRQAWPERRCQSRSK